MTRLRRAAIVSPIRTAVGKFQGALAPLQAGDLGAVILKALVERTKLVPERIDDVIFAQGYASGEAPAIGRWAALAAGYPISVPGYQLDRRCGSGLQAVVEAAMFVQTGAADVVVAGGAESMTNVEYYSTDMRSGARAGSVTMHDRLQRGRVMSQPIARFGVAWLRAHVPERLERVALDRHPRAAAVAGELFGEVHAGARVERPVRGAEVIGRGQARGVGDLDDLAAALAGTHREFEARRRDGRGKFLSAGAGRQDRGGTEQRARGARGESCHADQSTSISK